MAGGIEVAVDHVVVVAVGAVVDPLPLLVLDYLLLLGQHRLGDRVDKAAQLVGLGPDHLFQRVARDRLKVVGAVAARGSVGPGPADAGAHLVEAALAEVFRFQEEQVLEEVGKARAPLLFPRRADVGGQGHGHHRVGGVDVQHHLQAVVEAEFGEGDGKRAIIRHLCETGQRKESKRNQGQEGSHRMKLGAGNYRFVSWAAGGTSRAGRSSSR